MSIINESKNSQDHINLKAIFDMTSKDAKQKHKKSLKALAPT